MKVTEAIAKANELRPNALNDEQKARWLYELDCDVADLKGVEHPAFEWPEVDAELLMPAPHDNIYVLYLAAQIDYYNQESTLYMNDMTVFNSAYDDACAWWRRNNVPESRGNWKVM